MPDSLVDKHGNTYRIISNRWLKGLTILCVINFIILLLIVGGLVDNIRRVESAMSFSDKMAQRNMALSDIAASRAKANIWAFEKTCELIEQQGKPCMDDPKWYADPTQYPLIANDPAGAGLFPPKESK